MILYNFFYYLICASAVLFYGIGINRAVLLSRKPKHLVADCIKMLITVESSATLSYLILSKALVKADLAELAPFVAVMIFSVISVFVEATVRIITRKSMAEYTVSILCIILSLMESFTLAECVLNACFYVLTFYLLIPVFVAVRKRIELSYPAKDFKNLSLLFISIAVIVLALLTYNVSWLTPGVLQ